MATVAAISAMATVAAGDAAGDTARTTIAAGEARDQLWSRRRDIAARLLRTELSWSLDLWHDERRRQYA
jgi:hypothetical protein